MPNPLPKISIVTPSFNQGAYLEETILSVINQGYPNLEYIIVDGGSTDNSVEIIKKYENHLAWWVSEKDNGLYDALQKGFARSTGEIMAWLNSDDMYHSKSLFVVAKTFQAFPKVRWLLGKSTFYNEEGETFVLRADRYFERWSKWRFYNFKDDFIQQESVFWHRSLWEEAGSTLDTKLSLAGDFELWLRFFQHEKLYSTSFILSGFRIRSKHQKSKEQISEYHDEVRHLLKAKKTKSDALNVFLIKIVLSITTLLPWEKMRNKITSRLLQLPPKIIFKDGSMGFDKYYKMS